MMHRKFTFLLLLIVAALLSVSCSRDQEATGTGGRDESEETTYVQYDNRAQVLAIICDRAEQRFFDEAEADLKAGTGIFNVEGDFVFHRKPVISKLAHPLDGWLG